jgi:hypothetical protein
MVFGDEAIVSKADSNSVKWDSEGEAISRVWGALTQEHQR